VLVLASRGYDPREALTKTAKPKPAKHTLIPFRASLRELPQEAQDCKNCDLRSKATQTVFGEGHPHPTKKPAIKKKRNSWRTYGALQQYPAATCRTACLPRKRPSPFYFFAGTFAPFFRASESPMAIACFLFFTRPPLPAFPERKVPCFFLRIALSTDLAAAFPYFAILPPFTS
jgi:hypothetical protein